MSCYARALQSKIFSCTVLLLGILYSPTFSICPSSFLYPFVPFSQSRSRSFFYLRYDRLPSSWTKAEIESKVEDVLKVLKLEHIQVHWEESRKGEKRGSGTKVKRERGKTRERILTLLQNSFIGDEITRGVSGGERKRVSILLLPLSILSTLSRFTFFTLSKISA